LFHFDVYRLNSLKDIEDIGYEDYLARNGIVVIEWSNKMDRILPVRHLAIAIRICGPEKRSLTIKDILP
jgi:tRNA threonylcarbamoyladenosine biosynthesis protein TsaE